MKSLKIYFEILGTFKSDKFKQLSAHTKKTPSFQSHLKTDLYSTYLE